MKETTNKNPIKQRMILFLDSIGSNANQFAEKFIALGILGDNTKNYLHSKSGIQSDMLAQISKNYPQLNMNWLLTGEGDMILFQLGDLSENELNLSENSTGKNSMKKATMTIKERLVTFLDYLRIGQNKFEANVGISIGYVNKVKNSIGSEVIEKIANAYPELNISWLVMEKGSMLLPESENLSENKSNLAKQSKEEERLFGTKEIKQILNKQREIMTEEFGKMIMDNMTNIITKQLDVLTMQIKTQAETIQGQKDSIDKVLNKITGVEEKAGEIVKMVKKIG